MSCNGVFCFHHSRNHYCNDSDNEVDRVGSQEDGSNPGRGTARLIDRRSSINGLEERLARLEVAHEDTAQRLMEKIIGIKSRISDLEGSVARLEEAYQDVAKRLMIAEYFLIDLVQQFSRRGAGQ